jgi:hypothetical protein
MIFCKELQRNFNTKTEMIAALVASKEEIIALKKSATKTTDGQSFTFRYNVALKEGNPKLLSFGDTIQVVMNTTNYLDSHNDLHVNGIWNKSAKEQSGKTYHIINHDLQIGSIVAYPKSLSIEVRQMTWKELQIDAEGSTEALIFLPVITEKTNRDAFLAYRDGEEVQHSIRMEYVNIALAVDDPDMEKEYGLFNSYLPIIVNKEVALERGYFWVVYEAKISKEGSTVLFGSNQYTPTLPLKQSTSSQPPKSTEGQPPKKFDFSKALSEHNFFN